MTYNVKHYINGQEVSSAPSLPIYNPSQGTTIGTVNCATTETINDAVDAAKHALPTWQSFSVLKRARIMANYKSLLEQHKQDLAILISREHGKTLSDAIGEVQRGIEVVEFACGAPYLLKGHYSADISNGIDCYDMRKPIGICAGITPFNFPVMIALWMFPLALVCGNTFILKPSEKDPSASMLLIKLLEQAGVPQGVVNIVHGDKIAVNAILSHPDITAVSFVGSTPTAKYIYEQASAHGKRVQALGGAKNHCVVMADADITKIASGITGAAYGSAGERCMAISVVVAVGKQTADKLVAALTQEAKKLKVAASDDKNADIGPLITDQHRQNILALIQSGIDAKATLVLDGRDYKVNENENGFYLGPSLFDHVTTDMQIYQREIFGPVLCVVRVDHLEEAINLINQNPYANGSIIYTQNGAVAQYFTQNIHAGMVGINVPIPVPMAFYSFGGWKNSFFGISNMYGDEGIRFYTRLQTVSARWEWNLQTEAQFIMPVLE